MKRITVHGILVLALWWIGVRPAAAQSTTLHVGFNGFYGAASLYVAQDAGIFRKHGLTGQPGQACIGERAGPWHP
jgi:hypothetical protein